jgi:hypothetical protein
MIIKAILSGLLALAVIASAAGQAVAETPGDGPASTAADNCHMYWSDGSWTRPVFKC